MSLCCYCNLCTYPCPTDCIYMTPEYEFATTDLTQHLYHFAKKDAKFITDEPEEEGRAAEAAAAGSARRGHAAAPAAPPRLERRRPRPPLPSVPQTPPASPAGA